MLEEIAVSTTKAEARQVEAAEKETQIEIDSVRIGEEKAAAEAAIEKKESAEVELQAAWRLSKAASTGKLEAEMAVASAEAAAARRMPGG